MPRNSPSGWPTRCAAGSGSPSGSARHCWRRCARSGSQQPTRLRLGRIIGSALRQSDEALTATVSSRLDDEAKARLWALIETADDDPGNQDGKAAGGPGEGTGPEAWAVIRSDPGNVSLNTCKTERRKLDWIRAVGLPRGAVRRHGAEDRGRVAGAGRRSRPRATCAMTTRRDGGGRCWRPPALPGAGDHRHPGRPADRHGAPDQRPGRDEGDRGAVQREIPGGSRARRTSCSAIAEASLAEPGRHRSRRWCTRRRRRARRRCGTWCASIKTKGPTYRRTVQTELQGLLHQPLPARADPPAGGAGVPVEQHRAPAGARGAGADRAVHGRAGTRRPVLPGRGDVPVDGVIAAGLGGPAVPHRQARPASVVRGRSTRRRLPGAARPAALQGDLGRRRRPVAQPRRGPARRLRGPPGRALRQPPQAAGPGRVHRRSCARRWTRRWPTLNDARCPELDWLEIAERARPGRSSSPPLDAAPEPRNLRRLKTESRGRWGTVPLIDMLKEAVLRTGCLDAFTPVGTAASSLPPRRLFERLLLAVYAYGTNTGIRAVAAGDHGHGEDDAALRRAAATSPSEAARRPSRSRSPTPPSPPARPRPVGRGHRPRWRRTPPTSGPGTRTSSPSGTPATAGRGVLIYWHVETAGRWPCTPSSSSCSASEVARDGRGRDAPRHHDGRRGQLRRHPRPVRDRVRDHPAARTSTCCRGSSRSTRSSSTGPPQATRTPTRGWRPALTRPDPLGPDRAELRPDDQVRHRDPDGHRLHRGDPAPVHSAGHPPRLPGDARDRPRAEDHLRRPLPARPRPAARDRTRA